MHLCPVNAPCRTKPSSECTQLFTFSPSLTQLLSISGKPTHPADGATIHLWSPMPSRPLLRSGSPSLFPWFAHPPIFPLSCSNNRSSPRRMHWCLLRHGCPLSSMHRAVSEFLHSPQVPGFSASPSIEPSFPAPLSAPISSLSCFMKKARATSHGFPQLPSSSADSFSMRTHPFLLPASL